ncbi:MAG: radical SAM protein [Symploca sp. SIO2C1]|nr:radical SAM protein [Symploca sp. SIO2C1]
MNIIYTNHLVSYIKRHLLTSAPFLTPFKLLNAAIAAVEMQLGKLHCKSRPINYRIDPCTACNIRCPGCGAHQEKTKRKRLLSLSDFKTIIDKIKRFSIRAALYDSGEPLLNKNIYKMIGYASNRGIATSISTNFTLFEPNKHLDALMESRLTTLQPDLDGITQETYGKYRIGGNVETVKTGIEAVVKRKKETGEKYPIVEPQMIMFEHLMPEKEEIETYLKQVGVDKFTWKPDDWGFNPAQIKGAQKKKVSSRCIWLYLSMMIRPDGNVYPCCGKGLNRFAYGNILEESLDEIWNNKYYQFSRKLFTPGPDLEFDPEMENLPCHNCKLFQKARVMKPNPAISNPVE